MRELKRERERALESRTLWGHLKNIAGYGMSAYCVFRCVCIDPQRDCSDILGGGFWCLLRVEVPGVSHLDDGDPVAWLPPQHHRVEHHLNRMLSSLRSLVLGEDFRGDPLSQMLQAALSWMTHGRVSLDVKQVSQYLTLAFVGFVSTNSLRAFIKQLGRVQTWLLVVYDAHIRLRHRCFRSCLER